MPKVGKNSKLKRAARRVAASDPLPTASTTKESEVEEQHKEKDHGEPNSPGGQAMSRGQRKRQAKREQFLKKENMILSTLMLQKREEQKRRIDGLDAIREALLDTTKTSSGSKEETKEERKPNFGTNRAKKGLVVNEIQRMNLVLEHPAFKADPLGTIQEHLRNSLADQKEKQEKEAVERAKQDQAKKETKKQEKKEQLRGIKKNRKKYKPRRCK